MDLFEKILKGRRTYGVLGVLVFILYGRSLFFDITLLDDNLLVDSARSFAARPDTVGRIFTQHLFGEYYRPVLIASFVPDALIAGDSLLPFHLSNILYHAAAVLLLFSFLTRLQYGREAAFCAAALFAVHPALAQAVNWLPGRNDSLVTLLVLGSLISLDKFLEEGKGQWLAANLSLVLLAMFTKEIAVMLPVLNVFYLIGLRENGGSRFRQARKALPLAAAWAAMAGIFLACRRLAFSGIASYPLPEMAKAVWSDSPGLLLYLGKIFLPFNLSVFPSLPDSRLDLGLISAAGLAAALCLTGKNRRRYRLFGLTWFVLFLLPTFIHPSLIRPPVFFEHRLYLPMIGIIIAVLEVIRPHREVFRKALGQGVFAALMIMSMAINFNRGTDFKNMRAFWENAAAGSPRHAMAHLNLGAVHVFEGNDDAALAEFHKAIDLNASELSAHNNIALIYEKRGDVEQAKKYFEQEISFNPGYATAYFNYGLLHFRENNPAEAIRCWEKTIGLDPDFSEAYYNMAVAYDRLGDRQQSDYYLDQFRKRKDRSGRD